MIQIDSMWWGWVTLIAGAILTALVLAVGHWFPWPRMLDRVSCYIYGVLSILAGFAAWRLLNADWQTVAGLVVICCAGGGTVKMAYKIDGWVIEIRKAHKIEATNADLLAE